MDNNIKIYARIEGMIDDKISLYIISKSKDYTYIAKSIEMEQIADGEIKAPALRLNRDESQRLIDQLWDCGLRPTDGSGSAGSLLATQNHLKDLQKYMDKLIDRIVTL
jgi:hypothetical protein